MSDAVGALVSALATKIRTSDAVLMLKLLVMLVMVCKAERRIIGRVML